MITKIFPFLAWFRGYRLADLRIDALSGLTVALVLIPQSMAYAQLAGLPAFYGLYAAFLPPVIAALFGSSRQLATGPVAVVSLMTNASLAPLATAGSQEYIAYAIVLALLVGVFQFLLGVLRLGLVVNFLSHPVVNGFTNAAALIIATSQLSKMFGVYVDNAEHHVETIALVCKAAVNYTHWPTLIMGLLAFGIMYGLKWLNPRIPFVLVAVALTTLASWLIGFEQNRTVGIEAIADPAAVERIAAYNQTVAAMDPLAKERTLVNQEIEAAKATHDEIAVLQAMHKAELIATRLQKIKEEAGHLRAEIRDMLFQAEVLPDDSLRFHPKGAQQPDANGDGRTWRIKVGSFALKTDQLVMMGGGAVVGSIPRGLPAFSVPTFNVKIMSQLLPYAIIISLLGFMEAISIAKAMAAKTGQRLDPNQELIGQGLANVLGAIGKSYPVSGSFSRSAVNLQAGALSGISSAFTSLAVVIVLLFFTPLLYHLPQAVLAAVIMMAVIGLINVSGFIHAWHAKWYDGAISIVTFFATLAFAPHLDKGIMIGVVLSLIVFLYKSMRPSVASLARAEDNALRCAATHGLEECQYVAMVRFDGPLFFANATYLEDKITEIMLAKSKLKHIIIVANGINDIDASGEEMLSLLVDRVRSAGVGLSLSGVNESVMTVFHRTHLQAKIGDDNLFATMEKAIAEVHSRTHEPGGDRDCPLLTVCRLA
ncbi:MAG: SulP family inorganic anion transporter, partial [Desulfobacteraceae bacterium]|nr:SulP family inorganic anion transporter [Desulfobacteraceae bacterium]